MRFRMMLYHPPLVLEARIPFGYFDHGYDLERKHFSADIRVVSISGSDVKVWKRVSG